jgi:transcriptional regulator
MMVLQTLRLRPLHGYALAQSIKRASDELVHVEEGSLYPALQRMLKAGWLTAEWGLSERNREVRVYKLTALGRKQLEKKVNAFERLLAGVLKVMKPVRS